MADEISQPNVFYLAYGSNLSAETFLGRRGIKPLSSQNVHCPTLTLTFDLPGIPYVEPCFANVRYTDPSQAPAHLPKARVPHALVAVDNATHHKLSWNKGVVGVVYEVTRKDYDTIIATEGGGTSYHDIVVPCHPLPSDTIIVPREPEAEPIMAHTLFSPHHEGRSRPDPNWAQPSPRYLNLITSGAGQHSLPSEYREYLGGLVPYRPTSIRQEIGRAVIVAFWSLPIMALIMSTKYIAGKDGRVPAWYGSLTKFCFGIVWVVYDKFYKPLFGEGEHTIEPGFARAVNGEAKKTVHAYHDEKRTLLEREQDIIEEQAP